MTKNDLEKATIKFFELHWPALYGTAPGWKPWTDFLYGSVPSFDRGGCYALFRGNELWYVGLGISRGSGLYAHHGLSKRLMSHVYRSHPTKRDRWLALKPNWEGVTGLYTIGFEHEHAYLAAALEQFLIRTLAPRRNVR